MADFSWKNVEDLRLGDEIDLGGYVLSRGESFVPPGKLFEYLGTHVTETHTVFEEGRFVRVEDSLYGKRIDHDGTEVIVHPIVTQFHLMHLETHISTDLTEVDDWKGRNPDDIIAELNNDTDRVARLCAIARSNAADHYQGLRRLERMVESDQ